MSDADAPASIELCNGTDLVDSGLAVPFEVNYNGRDCAAFAIRFQGKVHAYLNQCSHVPMEMDYQPNRFFDLTGEWLICATHGAMYHPASGHCRAGPCRGALVKIEVTEVDGMVHWHTAQNLLPAAF